MTTYMPHIANDMKVKIEMTEQEKLALLFLPASKGTLKQTALYLSFRQHAVHPEQFHQVKMTAIKLPARHGLLELSMMLQSLPKESHCKMYRNNILQSLTSLLVHQVFLLYV